MNLERLDVPDFKAEFARIGLQGSVDFKTLLHGQLWRMLGTLSSSESVKSLFGGYPILLHHYIGQAAVWSR